MTPQNTPYVLLPCTFQDKTGAKTACLILKPLHALRAKLSFKELRSQLASQQRNVLYDGQPHPPVLVLSQLLNGWQQALSQQINANHLQHF